MELSGLQIFKYTPAAKKLQHTNCKDCGCPTCMIFSMKLAKQQIEIDKCPYLDEELKDLYLQNIRQAQKTIEINGLKIGGEDVLYRHEKTFNNPTALAVIVDCSIYDYKNKIKEICDFELKWANEVFKVDLIILKNLKDNSELLKKSDGQEKPIFITFEEFKALGFNIIEEQDFQVTKNLLIETRCKAIIEKDENYSAPTCVVMKKDDEYSVCARASYYLCKYANMIAFQAFDKNTLLSLIMLRQNIYTDPNKTLQVDSGLYEFNNPDKTSIIFLTTNFALTYYAVASELESLPVPSYLIVVPAQGMSVLTAWSAETFNPEVVKQTLEKLDIKNKIDTRKIIIPGLLGEMTEELQQYCPDFKFIKGTNEASDISKFVENLLKK
jgi:acetyl-CoA decarbonylase/synthase complex subunit gamma